MNKTTTPAAEAPWGRIPPALDLRKLFDKLDLPERGRRLLDTQRKDIEALVEANRQAYRALEALGQRQQEILRAALEAWQAGARDVIAAPRLADRAGKTLGNSQQAFSQALTDLRELAELALQSNKQVLGVLEARVKAHLHEIGLRTPRGQGGEAAAAAAPKAAAAPVRRGPAATTRRRKTAG